METTLFTDAEVIYLREMVPKRLVSSVTLGVTIVVPLAGILAWLSINYLPAEIARQDKELSNAVAGLKTDVLNTKSEVQRIGGIVDKLLIDAYDRNLHAFNRIKHENADVAKQRLKALAELTTAASQAKLQVEPKLVAQAGKTALELAKNPELFDAAWQVGQRLIDYHFFLNVQQAPSTAEARPVRDIHLKWTARPLPGVKSGMTIILALGTAASRQEGAWFEEIGKPWQYPVLPKYFVVTGVGYEVKLDGYHIKNVIFRDIQIVYEGGPLILQNVYFVNCKFVMKRSPRGERLSAALLFSAATNFPHSAISR